MPGAYLIIILICNTARPSHCRARHNASRPSHSPFPVRMTRSRPAKSAAKPVANRPLKTVLHPRNRHRDSYDFVALVAAEPALAAYVSSNRYGSQTIDFANPIAVKLLNRALLKLFYGVADWDIPPGYLCPPIPGRADYLHGLADLLAANNGGVIPRGPAVRVLDIGTGANLVYPLIGQHEYGWRFVGVDIDRRALANAEVILRANPSLQERITLRQQPEPAHIFSGVVQPDEHFDLTLCNPPFHASASDAAAGTERKWRGLAANRQARGQRHAPAQPQLATALNFGGQNRELYCPGGELAFIRQMVEESRALAHQIRWFSTLVSKASNLPGIYRALTHAGATQQQTVAMAQGQKQSRFVAWTFLPVDDRPHAAQLGSRNSKQHSKQLNKPHKKPNHKQRAS